MPEPQSSPAGFDAVLFDLDGVVTHTARVHAAAWKALFDPFLRRRAAAAGEAFVPFDDQSDYLRYVDGKPRGEGLRSFLAARGIVLPDAEAATLEELAARKDELFRATLHREGVEVFDEAVTFVRLLRQCGVATAVVTSSRNGREVLRAAGISDLFDVRVDGLDAAAFGLAGKPNPDTFLKAAELLGVAPARAVVIEDAVSGVEAARGGAFGLVVGVDAGGNRQALLDHGADLVVRTLAELDPERLDRAVAERRDALAWQVELEGIDPAREHAAESLFTVGNGYFGVRGALDDPLPGSQADLFIAGIYDRKHPDRPYSELEFLAGDRGDHQYSELVSLPFPLRLRLGIEGQSLNAAGPGAGMHRRRLDLRHGILHAQCSFDTGVRCRTLVESRRCASRADLHLLLQEVQVHAENHSGRLTFDASIVDHHLAVNHPHLVVLGSRERGDGEVQTFRTRASGFVIALATRVLVDGRSALRGEVHAAIGVAVTLRRFVAIYTSRDVADPEAAAVAHLDAVGWETFEPALAAHAACWAETWARADIRIDGSPAAVQALRFNAYHLVSAADHDPGVSVGARALTGRAYEGHVFWDVEMFKLPFYLHTAPEVARVLLRYRHGTLDGARRRARLLGSMGACYAWESTVTGDDVTPQTIRLRTSGRTIPIFTGTQQVHVTAAVAHAVWRYWEATQDEAFLCEAGVEILVETARFWTDRSTPGPRGYHIRGVVGPDEYHHSVDDNAYTNWMARDNLDKAARALDWLAQAHPRALARLAERCGLGADEPGRWRGRAASLYCPGPDEQGVIEQFDGFFKLDEYPLAAEQRFRAPISRLFDWDRINRLKVIKQADVLMLLHVFPDAFPQEVVAANYRYYEPLTDHGSSLSPGIHAAVAARLGLRDEAERYWRESLWLDLSNTMANSSLGVHPACMGATWQALVFGWLGVRFTDDGIRAAPAAAGLPGDWQRVSLALWWRGRTWPLVVEREAP